MDEERNWQQFVQNNRGKIIGTLIGVLIALCFLYVGFWRTLFIGILGGIGFYFGARRENRERFFNFVDELFRDVRGK